MSDWIKNLDNIAVDYDRNLHQWVILNDNGQIQCKCKKPMIRTSAKSTLLKCEQCMLSVDSELLKVLYNEGVFLDWPRACLPACKKCLSIKLAAYASYINNQPSNKREMTIACACKPARYFRVSNGDEQCWNYVSSNGVNARIDVEKASNLPPSNGVARATYKDSF